MSADAFPPAPDEPTFDAIRGNDELLAGGVRGICRRHGVSEAPQRFAGGSLPVYALGARMALKLFPPYERTFWETECAALERWHGRISIPTPGPIARGEYDGWWYVLMDRLAGEPLTEAWADLSEPDRIHLIEALGRAAAELHALDASDPGPLGVDWAAFMMAQSQTAVERQRRRGVPDAWLEQIEPFLAGVALPEPGRLTYLHTELMREHLVVQRGHPPVLSGLMDFEPAMVGAPEYELASVGLFVTCGEPGLFRRFVLAYAGREPDAELSRRCLAYALLHRYSNLPLYFERLRPPPSADRLEHLAELWWGLDP